MRKARRLAALLMLAGAAASTGGCTSSAADNPSPAPTPAPTPAPGVPADCPADFSNGGLVAGRRNCVLPRRILQDLRLPSRAGTVYSLSGRVEVGADVGSDGRLPSGVRAVLTVDPGVVVFGTGGLDYLVVNRGSRLEAAGTADNPIVFTSRANLEGLTTDDSQGQWGGIILLGMAPISDCLASVPGGSAGCEQVYEGLTDTRFGGGLETDSSGTLRYVQIRYAGFELAPDQEINGLTLAGAGSGTAIDYVQVHNSSDDAIEWFGGRAGARHLVLTGNDDDSLDTDLGYQGFIQFVIAVQRAGGRSGDELIEADSPGNEDSLPRQWTRLANATLVQNSSRAASALLLRGGTDYTIVNSVIVTSRACLSLDGAATVRAADPALADQGPPQFRSVVMSCGSGAYLGTGSVPEAVARAIFEVPGTQTNPALVSTLTALFVDGPNELAVPAFDAATLGSFFTPTSYIGAVRDANDTWYRGWTCNSTLASLGGAKPCTAAP